jgi:hypothetical protein
LLLCNPFYNNCLYQNEQLFPTTYALVGQWVLSGTLASYVGYIWHKSIIKDNLSFGGAFPYFHFATGGYYIVFWTLAAGFTVLTQGSMFITGAVANLLHKQKAFQAFAMASNINGYVFTFLVWWMIMVTAYLELQVAKVDGLSELAKNFYKFAFFTLSS